jgi:NADH-quinone oxidoreductase subunit L
MEGPTPVSALIHAATMVAAGVYLVARFYPVFAVSEDALLTIAIIGSITTIGAALLGIVATDIKRVMAYSTISQLGYMMMGLGVGGMVAAIFHLFTHAFFKALLFLGAGSVNHATGTFDMRLMGGLRKYMPITYGTMIVASLALVGIFPFAGFWSKDEILADAWADSPWVFVVGMAGVYLTALYVGRMMIMTFAGEYRGGMQAEDEEHEGDAHAGAHHLAPHESPSLMTVPLLVLAVLAFAAGFLNVPGFHWLGDILEGWLPHETEELLTHTDFKLWIAVTSVAIGLAGLGTAWAIYQAKMLDAARIRSFLQPLPQLLDNRYYLDYLYETVFVKELVLGSARWGLALWDEYVIDGAVNGLASATGWSAKQLRLAQTGQVQLYGGVMFLGTIAAVVGILVVNP